MAHNPRLLPKKVGLALGSGSARGWAHIGVIRTLAEAGIEISHVAGASIGSLVGAAYALGKLDAIEQFALGLDIKQIISLLDVTFPRSGLIDGLRLTDLFRSRSGGALIENLPTPFRAVATDLYSGREVVLGAGDVVDAVRASISIPGIFTPVRKGASFLVDGGLVDPVPVSVARNMGAEFVVAVDLHGSEPEWELPEEPVAEQDDAEQDGAGQQPKWKFAQDLAGKISDLGAPALSQVRDWFAKDPVPSIFEVLTASISVMEARVTAVRLAADPPDLLLQPRLGHIRSLEFHRALEAIEAGRTETRQRLGLDA